ncbi:glycosyltransferase family 4 protein [Pedobacter sp. MC2016-14]|uniref:glycosyltransferase family 4 protein n=1 Tax=Pedobacter sp. MC2016-14 TaxID=2897327 RepID=UPI001E4E6706|nr:glycosyltransferase family 4 protein [Pedobacter sp. MC2016-14]MCD0488349.1 glycosyltransferase family 4 protein [Pedobacter sp. MC2016-14]
MILFVSHKYPPATGGMEKQSLELINGIQKYLPVHLLVYEGEGSRIRFFLKLHRRIREICKEHPEISIIHFNDGLMAACSLLHKIPGHLKRTVTVHGLDVVYPNFIYRRLILPVFNRFDLIFAVSQATAQACIERNIAAEKIVVVNNGVDTEIRPALARAEVEKLVLEKYHTDLKNRRILVVMGRPVKRKGFSWFIKNVLPSLDEQFLLLVIGPVSKKSTGSRFFQYLPAFVKTPVELFLGTPSDESKMEALIKQSSMHNNVVRMGKLPFEEISAILGIADAFLMPNIPVSGDMEGFGLVCLEAAMCGTKVYAAATGGITDAIKDGKNGMLLPPAHRASWIYAINHKLQPRKASAADATETVNYTIQHFSWERMTGEYLAHFLKLFP